MSNAASTELNQYQTRGWLKFDFDPVLNDWVDWTLPYAKQCLSDESLAEWWRYQNTWFVGVNALANDKEGSIDSGPVLSGVAVDFMRQWLNFSLQDLDQAQVSAIFSGYPKPHHSDSEAGFKYRLNRDAAHVDGLLKLGANGERYALEYHQYILAIPLNSVSALASPLVLWEKSHLLMRDRFQKFFDQYQKSEWPSTAVNEIYQQTRREIFMNFKRIEVSVQPGQALLIDRHMLHGTSPWRAEQGQDECGRLIAFFRPQYKSMQDWLA